MTKRPNAGLSFWCDAAVSMTTHTLKTIKRQNEHNIGRHNSFETRVITEDIFRCSYQIALIQPNNEFNRI